MNNMNDAISRQQAIDIAKELTITIEGYEMHNQAVMNYCAEIIQLPPIQPDNNSENPNGSDVISRRDAIEAVQNRHMMLSKEKVLLINDLEKLPPVAPIIGKWENIVDGFEYIWATCDSCGVRIPMPYKYYKFCPNCMADMREVTT